jgi:copper chaperone CopZ
MKRSNISAAGSVLTAIVASVCCIGPALLALVGAGSIGAFGALESYRPYFIGLTVILLALAFFLTYRKWEVACEDGSCKVVKAGKWNKIGVWTSAIIALVAILFPYTNLTPMVSAASVKPTGTQGQLATAVLNIKGMDCEACANGLQASLSQIKGVESAAVKYKSGSAVIEYDPAEVAPTVFTNFLTKAGYKSTVVKTIPVSNGKDPTPASCPGCS